MKRTILLLTLLSATAASAWFVHRTSVADEVTSALRPASTAAVDASGSGIAGENLLPTNPSLTPDSALVAMSEATGERFAVTAPRRVGQFGPQVPDEGRTATLLPLLRLDGVPVAGEILVSAGPEEGLRVPVGASGTPEPVALFPGLAIVEVRTADGALCRRELLLEHRRETTLELDFVDRGFVLVEVTGEDGSPVERANVLLDGVPGSRSQLGSYRCALSVSGAPLLTINAPGYAPYRKLLSATVDSDTSPQSAELASASALTIHLPMLPGIVAQEPATIVLVPSGAPMSRTAPVQSTVQWEGLTTATVWPGDSVRIEDLPRCRLEIFAYHGAGTIGPDVAYVDGKKDADLTLSSSTFSPAAVLSGHVFKDGEPVANARVSLSYANPIRATHRLLGSNAKHARRMPIALLPQVEQEVQTDEHGHFQLGVNPEVMRRPPYVSVTSPDGELIITRIVNDTSDEQVFELNAPAQ